MRVRQPRYSKEEFARQAIYEQQVRAQVEEGNSGRIVAIDIETGEFEVADDPLAASDQLFARCPDAPVVDPHRPPCATSVRAVSCWYLSTGPTTDDRSSRVPRFRTPQKCTP